MNRTDMRLYFIRHGQSANNALWEKNKNERGRSFDPVLTEIGHAQAECVAQFLRDELALRPNMRDVFAIPEAARPTVVYTSLMTRAVATGIVIARALHVPLVALHEAHEAGGLYLEDETTGEKTGVPGPNRAHFEQNYPELVLPESLGESGWWDRPFEPDEVRHERAERVWQDLLGRHGNTNDVIALVTHGAFYDHLLRVILNAPRENHIWFPLNNCGVSRLELTQHGLALVYHNRFDFLPPQLITL
ncbi:MAG TPA: histidine phosphatase family protein [Anaerolineae bacterium]|nr:histidine phosphatase family protein [Anaerolineae bacterium]